MDDPSIRRVLIPWIQIKNGKSRIYQEKSIGSAICDVMVVTDCLVGFEIKSDTDNYQRLARQIGAYNCFFDKNYIVVGKAHTSSIAEHVPLRWGILCVDDTAGVSVIRKPQQGFPSLKEQLSILWRPELCNILTQLNLPSYTYKNKAYIIARLVELEDCDLVHRALVNELLNRDYSIYNAKDPTICSGQDAIARPSAKGLPAGDIVDALSEIDEGLPTLEEWMAIYSQAKRLRQAKEEVANRRIKERRINRGVHRIRFDEIETTLGCPWVSDEIMNDFALFLYTGKEQWEWGEEELRRFDAFVHYGKRYIEHEPVTGCWYINDKGYLKNDRTCCEYGLRDYSAFMILEAALNSREIKRSTSEDTLAAMEKLDKIKALFSEWLGKDEDRRWEIEEAYEHMFGTFGPRSYDGSRLDFPHMDPSITLLDYQKDAIERILNEKNTLLAFEVGSGKTFIMIAAAMKMRQTGVSRKNMFVVPNSIVGQWELMFKTLYPTAKVLTVGPSSFRLGMRQKVLKQMKIGDYDGIIVAYSVFDMIPISEEYVLSQVEADVDRIKASVDQIRCSVGLQRAIEREKEYLCKLSKSLFESTDACFGTTFDQLEVNTLFVDEAHNFKNIPLRTKMKGIAGINVKGSKKCLRMQRKVRCVQDQNNGRGVVFATGTPLCNSITDAYAMQMYLQPAEMEQTHLDRFDNWIRAFSREERVYEIDVDATRFRERRRFSRFLNLPELSKMFSAIVAYYVSDSKADVPELCDYSDVEIDRSPELLSYIESLVQRTSEIRAKKIDKGFDNMLKVSGDGRKAALDLRLVGRWQPWDDTSKVLRCAQNVKDVYDRFEGSAQLIFCDLSTPKNSFNIYALLRSTLVSFGVPAKEIAFVHSCTSEASRVSLFESVNRGAVRILIGSTFKLGIGANVQTKLKAIHHLDIPWRPADMVQREGRIVRRGNSNREVLIFRYVTKGSFDAYSWQILESKQSFISQFLAGTSERHSVRDLEDDVLTYAQVKALALANPKAKELVEVENERRRYVLLSDAFDARKRDDAKQLHESRQRHAELEKQRHLAIANKAWLTRVSNQSMKDEVKLAARYVTRIAEGGDIPKENTCVLGFTLTHVGLTKKNECLFSLSRGGANYSIAFGSSERGNAVRLKNFFANFEKRPALLEGEIRKLDAAIAELAHRSKEDNPYIEQIALLERRVKQLQDEITCAMQQSEKQEE